jgi:predicted O-linked N-acetylglucosamine transferase (SPINDLY family)
LEDLQALRWSLAWESLQVLTSLNPQDAWAQQWRVVVALALQPPQPLQAIAAAEAALQTLPLDALTDRAGVACNMGQAHGLLGQHAQALAAFGQALAWQPAHPQALLGSAQVHAALGQHADAGRAVTQCLQHDPNNLEALALLGNTLVKAGDIHQAAQRFAQHEQIKPAAPFVACMVVFLMRQLADWRMPPLPINPAEQQHLKAAQGQRTELALLAHRARQHMPAIEPFAGLVLYDDPALQRHAAGQWLTHLHPLVPVPPAASAGAPSAPSVATFAAVPAVAPTAPAERRSGPLRVAYVSSEFMEHATSYLLAGVLARHNPARVQVFLLSYAPPPVRGGPDAMQQRIAAMGHTWVDVHTWSDAQVALWCREQGIDVAVDLKGLTRDSRPGIFAHRAAPVQVNWLGYPGTLPAPYYDWVLADAQVLPPALEPYFAERVWRLPHSYQPNDPDREIAASAGTLAERRASHGLPEAGPVLVCFNNTFKITPEVWAVWMRLLHARPDAVLWLLAGTSEAQQNLRTHAHLAGVYPQRLVFAPTLPQAQHLARLQLADLSLDTLPYNAHTTASDALWAGVPHVACTGQSFAARVGASVLTAAGMPELIAHGLPDYEALALRLLLDDAERSTVRQRLAAQRSTAPLWDAAGFACDLEDALLGMCGLDGV